MKTKTITILSESGESDIQIPVPGSIITVNCEAKHEDWEATLARITDFPVIPKGTQVQVVGWKQNFRGVHLKVKHQKWTYDIPLSSFKIPCLN